MLETIRNWIKEIEEAWWGVGLTYFSLFGVIYGATWTIMESADVPGTFTPPNFVTRRIFYLVVITLIVSAHTTLCLVLIYAKLKLRKKLTMDIYADNDEYNDYLCKYIASHDVKKAQLIQYSGDYVRRVVTKLLEKGADVELLLQHPSKSLNEYQLRKLVLFEQRSTIDFKNDNKLAVRYYDEPASLRAIKLDNKFLAIGWYTYRIRSKNKDREDVTPWLYGHSNPSITAHLDGVKASDLASFFDEVFNALWKTAVTRDKL
jgi:hypothetical protein